MTPTEARDALQGFVKTAWDAGASTTGQPLLYDDVDGDKPGHDADGLPIAFGRATVKMMTTNTETIGGAGVGKDQHAGQVVVQVFAPVGSGRTLVDAMAHVVARGLAHRRSGELWTEAAGLVDVTDRPGSPWVQTNVVCRFFYSERS